MSLTAEISARLYEACFHCLLGRAGDSRPVHVFIGSERFAAYRSDGTYGAAFTLRAEDFAAYDFAGEDDLVLHVDRSDLQRAARFAGKLDAPQMKLEADAGSFVVSSAARSGYVHRQGCLLLSLAVGAERRLLPVDTASTPSFGFCQIERLAAVRGQLEQFRAAAPVEIAVWPATSRLGITLSADNGRRIARWPRSESDAGDARQFFTQYTVERELQYRLSAPSLARILQVLTPAARALRIVFYAEALVWLFDVADGAPIYVRHDIPKMQD